MVLHEEVRENAIWENAGDGRYISESLNFFLSAISLIKAKRF
jgi:hypothetical protein